MLSMNIHCVKKFIMSVMPKQKRKFYKMFTNVIYKKIQACDIVMSWKFC